MRESVPYVDDLISSFIITIYFQLRGEGMLAIRIMESYCASRTTKNCINA